MSKEIREMCGNCSYWQHTGQADSGLKAHDGNGNWMMDMGKCNHPKPELGGAQPQRGELPDWSGCYQFKAKRKLTLNRGRVTSQEVWLIPFVAV